MSLGEGIEHTYNWFLANHADGPRDLGVVTDATPDGIASC